MITQYRILGMTCEGCQTKIIHILGASKRVKNVMVDFPSGNVWIESESPLLLSELEELFSSYPQYTVAQPENVVSIPIQDTSISSQAWWVVYRPILLVFAYLIGISALISILYEESFMFFMQVFMSGFFLIFSFFKMLDLPAFAESYAAYDIIAKKWKVWGYFYAFIELALGIAYLFPDVSIIVHTVTLFIMSISIIGVVNSLLKKQKVRCACLGTVFNLPMSIVTVIENGIMIIMSAIMLVKGTLL
ncbi:MAG: heavy-metal-associated domain-containing protein [Cytophagales bacterium]|nr:heavy-metal-associated domain-containing protein [Cytophagales bacterium]MDW8383378.1 heavy metal-associated domain-containing protein [Flammeovirgaceae bacterium]